MLFRPVPGSGLPTLTICSGLPEIERSMSPRPSSTLLALGRSAGFGTESMIFSTRITDDVLSRARVFRRAFCFFMSSSTFACTLTSEAPSYTSMVPSAYRSEHDSTGGSVSSCGSRRAHAMRSEWRTRIADSGSSSPSLRSARAASTSRKWTCRSAVRTGTRSECSSSSSACLLACWISCLCEGRARRGDGPVCSERGRAAGKRARRARGAGTHSLRFFSSKSASISGS